LLAIVAAMRVQKIAFSVFFIHSLLDTVGEGMFSGSPSAAFVHSSGQILLPRYLMNGWNSFDKTYGEYSLALTDDLVRFWRSKVAVTVGRRGAKASDVVDAGASKSIFWFS